MNKFLFKYLNFILKECLDKNTIWYYKILYLVTDQTIMHKYLKCTKKIIEVYSAHSHVSSMEEIHFFNGKNI